MPSFILDVADFSPTFAPIVVPIDCIFFRGYNNRFPELSDRPAFFAMSKSISSVYGNTLGVYKSTRPLALLDLRFVSCILESLLRNSPMNDMRYTLTLAYGLCSLRDQIKLYKVRYKDALLHDLGAKERLRNICEYEKQNANSEFDVPGVRLGETTNDAHAVLFLKSIFDGCDVDGYVAPSTSSPYHDLACEFVLFDPVSVLEKVRTPQKVRRVALNTLLKSDANIVTLHHPMPWAFQKTRVTGGGAIGDERNTFLASMSDREYAKLWAKTKAATASLPLVHLWDNKAIGQSTNRPVKTLQISPWPSESNKIQ